ncbi:MAG: Citryl-CoA lyase, partial [Rhizobacter sp.]|nr:Citryl-CoA lyase [Rhizobacter sp.]
MLYTPGSNAKVLAKAAASAADVLIFDLEDAVAPAAKQAARATVRDALGRRDWGAKEVVVRVNGLDTPWCKADVAAMADAGAAALLFPKIAGAADVARARALMCACGVPASTPLWAMIETPLAILNAHGIAQAAQQEGARMELWVMGTNDLVKELRASHTAAREPLLMALSTALLAARAYGLAILDGVHNDIQDADGFVQACEQGLALGFDGKTLIHPSQI